MGFQLELVEAQANPVSWGGDEPPQAALVPRVGLGVVGAGQRALGGVDDVLAAALLAVAPVVVQREAVLAGANIRAQGVVALVLAVALVVGALVDVREEHRGEA